MPGVSARFEWDASDLDQQLADLVERWPDHRRAILRAMGEDLVGGLKREIPTSSGTAKSTIRTIVGEDGTNSGQVLAGGQKGVDYIEPLLEGSAPHAPGPSSPSANPSLARWARRNGYPGGFESIYWSIYHYGTEPHDFVSEPIEETQTRAGDIAEAVLRRRGVFE